MTLKKNGKFWRKKRIITEKWVFMHMGLHPNGHEGMLRGGGEPAIMGDGPRGQFSGNELFVSEEIGFYYRDTKQLF